MSTTQFCPNDSINITIEQALPYLSEKDRRTFCKDFRSKQDKEKQFLDTFFELLAGVFVARMGYLPHYGVKIGEQKPDWRFVGREGRPDFFSEVRNFHPPKEREVEQDRALRTESFWSGWEPEHKIRLHESIWEKAGKYKKLANETDLPFVVFFYSWFTVILSRDQVEVCLYSSDGLFHQYPTLSGVYHYYWECGGYRFDFYKNPNATHNGFNLSNGFLPALIPPPFDYKASSSALQSSSK